MALLHLNDITGNAVSRDKEKSSSSPRECFPGFDIHASACVTDTFVGKEQSFEMVGRIWFHRETEYIQFLRYLNKG